MGKRLIGTGTTDENGNVTISYTGTGAGKLQIVAECGSLQSETYEIVDAIYYDPATSDRSSDYYLNTTYTSITFADNKYTLGYSGSTGAYVDIRSLTNALLGKIITVSVDVELGSVETRLQVINGSANVSATDYVTGTTTLKLENVELPSTSTQLIFRVTSRNVNNGDSIKFKNLKIYIV